MGFYFCNRNFKLCKILMSHREKEGGRNRSLVWLVAAAFCFPIPSVTLRVPRICSDQGYWEWIWHDRFVFFFSRKLDDNIRTVVRGQTNVGQDGRQVCAPQLRQSQWFSSCDAELRIGSGGQKAALITRGVFLPLSSCSNLLSDCPAKGSKWEIDFKKQEQEQEACSCAIMRLIIN